MVNGFPAAYAGDHPRGAEGAERRPLEQARPNHTVLVVEDEVLIRLMIADELRRANYGVIEAANAGEALDLLAHVSGISLVISDIRMPGSMDGLSFAQKVRAEHPAIRIIFASGDLPNINSVGHDGYFLKPYDAHDMVEHINTLLG